MGIFERNIEALKETSPAAAEAVLAVGGAPDGIEFLSARTGKLTVCFRSSSGETIHLHSMFDPEREAAKFAGSRSLTFGKWIVWFGPGLWYGVRELAKRMHHNPFCVIEPDPELLRAVMERVPLHDIFERPGMRVVAGSEERVSGELEKRPLISASKSNIVVYDPVLRMNPELYRSLIVSLSKTLYDVKPSLDAGNVVRREAFGGMDPSGLKILTTAKDRYSEAIEQTFAPLGVKVVSIFDLMSDEAMIEFSPDMIFSFSANIMTWPDTLTLVEALKKKLGVPLVLWNTEDPFYYHVNELRETFFRAVRAADLYLTQSKQLFDIYDAEGIETHYLPTAARPEMAGDPLPTTEQTLDFSFFGFWSAKRREFFSKLTKELQGMKYRLVEPGMAPEDFRDMIRHTKVNLTVFTCSDRDDYDDWALSDRVWEVPYAGGFILQDRRRHLADHFAPEETAVFERPEECAERIRYYVEHTEERVRIMKAACARIRAEHLMRNRMETVIEQLRRKNLLRNKSTE